MSKAPIVYVLEYGMTERGGELAWSPLLDAQRKPITFGGPAGKVRAIRCGKELALHPVYEALRVMRGAVVVWSWPKRSE